MNFLESMLRSVFNMFARQFARFAFRKAQRGRKLK